MTKLWLSVLCLALAATSVIRCDSDSSDSDSNGSDGDSGLEDSAACNAIAQYLSGDVTAPADQSRLLSSFFNDFDFDIRAFLLRNLPKLLLGDDFTFDIDVLSDNFDSFQNFTSLPIVQSILGNFSTAFENVTQTAESETSEIDRPLIRTQVEQLLSTFLAAIVPCELQEFGGIIRNLFEIDIFGGLVARAECNVGFLVVDNFITAANATQGLLPDVLQLNDGLIQTTPFIFGENYIHTLVSFVIQPIITPFTSIQDATDRVNDVVVTYVNTFKMCGPGLANVIGDAFGRLFNELFLNFIIESQGLEI